MEKESKVIDVVGMRVVGRPQTNGTLACLYNNRKSWDTLVLVGKVDTSSCQIINELQKTHRVIWDTGEGLAGHQAMRLMYHLKALELNDSGRVLFLDDDLIFNGSHITVWNKELAASDIVVIASPTSQTAGNDLKVMFEMPSFDLLCSMVRAKLINDCLSEYLWLLAELNNGGEFFFMHWMFERCYMKGVQDKNFIKIVDMVKDYSGRRPVHLWIPDKWKVWNDLSLEWWENLHLVIRNAKNVKEMRKMLNERNLLSKGVV